MDFTIDFYQTRQGRYPALKTLEKIKRDRHLAAEILAKIDKLRDSANHHLLKPLGEGLLQLRVRHARTICCFVKSKKIVVLHIFVKKRNRAMHEEIDVTRKRMNDYVARENE